MNEKALHLYDLMQTDLLLCRRKGLGMLREIECCFQIANRYWAILKHDLINHEFETAEKEIELFKKIKPLFISEAEYYSLRCHAQLFLDGTILEDQRKFWERELKRLRKFKHEHKDFYDRYKNNCTEKDMEWFMRNDQEDKAATSHDHLVATLLALDRYTEYIKEELKQLT